MHNKIKRIIAEALGIEETDITESSTLMEDLGMGTAEISMLVDTIQKVLNTSMPPEQLIEAKTVGELIDIIENYTQE